MFSYISILLLTERATLFMCFIVSSLAVWWHPTCHSNPTKKSSRVKSGNIWPCNWSTSSYQSSLIICILVLCKLCQNVLYPHSILFEEEHFLNKAVFILRKKQLSNIPWWNAEHRDNYPLFHTICLRHICWKLLCSASYGLFCDYECEFLVLVIPSWWNWTSSINKS